MTQATVTLESQELSKTYFSTDPPTEVLRAIDLTVRAGEFLVIMGASGSGKSTLLYSISGMDRPTSGNVALEGRELTSLSDAEMSNVRLTRMGFVFQQPHCWTPPTRWRCPATRSFGPPSSAT